MAHYASNLEASPATAPAIPPPTTSKSQGSHLTLPELRSASPLPTTLHLEGQGRGIPQEIDLTSETQSVSSASGVTYSFPTPKSTNQFTPATTTRPIPQQQQQQEEPTSVLAAPIMTISPSTEVSGESNDEDQLQRPPWAEEGLGSDELSTLPTPTSMSQTLSPTTMRTERPESPLPPGAAAAVTGPEPERSGTQ